MPFYMDIAEPARNRASKKLRPQTEVDIAYPARAPQAWEPDIPTAQPLPLAPSPDLSTMAGRMEASRAYPAQPEPGSIAARLGLERRDTLPLAQEDLFSKTGQAVASVGEKIGRVDLGTAQAAAIGASRGPEMYLPGSDAAREQTQEAVATTTVAKVARGELDIGEGWTQLGKDLTELTWWQHILLGLGPTAAVPVPLKGLPRAGYGKFLPTYDNYKGLLASDVWRDAPAATKAKIKTGIHEQIGERLGAQVRQTAPDLSPNRVDEIVDILIDDFMKPGMKPEEFQKHADQVINRVRGYGPDVAPTARPTVRPDAAPVPALEPAAPVGAALPEAAVTPSPAAAVPEPPAAVVAPEPIPVPEVTQRIAPGSTDPVEIRSSYNRELSAYGARRIPIEDVEGISYSEALEKRRDHIDGLREVFANRIAAEGGNRMVSPADIRRIGDDLLDEIRSQPEGQERVPRLIDLRTVRDVAPAEVGSHRVYHGTIATFDAFSLGAVHDDSLYGPGVYLTDDPNIASGYAKGALRVTRQIGGPQHGQPIDSAGNVISEQEANFLAQGAPQIWSVDVEVVKFFDIDAPPDKQIMDIIKEDPDAWDRGFDYANLGIDDIETNHDLYQVLHADFGNKSEVNDWLAMLGYDTITHVGGGRTGNLPHRVYIALGDPYIGDEITSVSPQFGPRRGKEPAVRVIEALPPAPTRPALQPGQAPAAAAPSPVAVPTPVAADVPRYTPEEMDVATKTARGAGAVGGKAIVPLWIGDNVPANAKILDFGSGPTAQHTTRLREAGFTDVTAHEFGANIREGIHSPDALLQQYDVVFASNVLNVQSSEGMLRRTLESIRQALKEDGYAVFNYPGSPRKAGLSNNEVQSIIEDIFPSARRVEKKGQGPMWQVSGQSAPSPAAVPWQMERNPNTVVRVVSQRELDAIRNTGVIKSEHSLALPSEKAMGLTPYANDVADIRLYAGQEEGDSFVLEVTKTPSMQSDYGTLPELLERRDGLVKEIDDLSQTLKERGSAWESYDSFVNWKKSSESELASINTRLQSSGMDESVLRGLSGFNLPYVMTPESVPASNITKVMRVGEGGILEDVTKDYLDIVSARQAPVEPPALPAQPPMAALPPSEPPPVAPTAAAAGPPPTPPPPPRGPEVFETGLDPEEPLTPFMPALVQDNLDRAALQIKLTTGEKGYLRVGKFSPVRKWKDAQVPIRPTGQTLNNIPGISQFQGFFFPKYRMTPELHQSWVASGMTEWELNTQMGLSRAKLFTELKSAFGENALKGWKPPIPGDEIKGGIQQMARYYAENRNTVYLVPFIGPESERRAFSGTLFDIHTRPYLYELDDAQRAALETWKSHQDDFMDIIVVGYGANVEKYVLPQGGGFLSSIDVGEDSIEASLTAYQAVAQGSRKRRIFDTAAEREDAAIKQNRVFVPETDIEVLQIGMDMAKAHWASQSTLKLGSGGLTRMELMEQGHPQLVARREATIRQVNSLKGRINTAERQAGGTQSELDLLETRINNLNGRMKRLDESIDLLEKSAEGPSYGPMLSHLSGELYSLRTVLHEAQKRGEILVERGVGLVEKDKDLIAQLETAVKEFDNVRKSYSSALPTIIENGKHINYTLVTDGGLYLWFPQKDINGVEVANAAKEIVRTDTNFLAKILVEIQQTVLGGDLSPLAAIQGHLALIANPQQITFKLVGAGKDSVQSQDMFHIFRGETMNKVIEENWDDAQDLARYIGMPMIANTPDEFAGGLLKYLKGNIGGKEYSYTKANDAMFAITLRNMLTGYQTNMKMLATAGITGEEAKIASALAVTDYIPLINWRLAGLSARQYNERRALVTSASYIVKPAELVSSTTTGLAKLASGQPISPQERLSLRISMNMIAMVLQLAVTTSVYAALRNDEDPIQAGLNAANPTHPDFATIHLSVTHIPGVEDQKLPMGAPFRAIAKMVAPREVSWSPVPVPFATLPQWAMNRVGPGLQTLFRAGFDRDFYGYKIRRGAGAEQAIRTVLFGLEGVLPLMPQELAGGLRRGTDFGKSVGDATWQFLGTSAREDSAWQERNKSAARWAESQDLNYDVGKYEDLRNRDRKLYDDTVLGQKEAEAVYETVKQKAEGGVPWAVPLLASMNAQREAEEAQLRDDQALEKFFDPTVTTTDPRLSLNPKDWKQQRKERALELRATKKTIFYKPEEKKWLPTYEFDEEEPTDRFFEKMASIMNDANLDRMDEKAWEDLDQWVSEQSQEDQEYIEMDAYGGALTDKVQEYYDDLEKLEKYFEIEEEYIATRSPEIQNLWKQYRHTNNQSRNESFLWRPLETTLGGLARRLKDYRRNNFEVDRLLAKWDYSGRAAHPDNRREFRRIPTRPDFYTSEEGASQGLPTQGLPAQREPTPSNDLFEGLFGESRDTAPSPRSPQTEDLFQGLFAGAR